MEETNTSLTWYHILVITSTKKFIIKLHSYLYDISPCSASKADWCIVHHMGQVTKVRLSCYLVLLSVDSKTREQDSRTFVTWPKWTPWCGARFHWWPNAWQPWLIGCWLLGSPTGRQTLVYLVKISPGYRFWNESANFEINRKSSTKKKYHFIHQVIRFGTPFLLII